ncbi:TetR family transcriptional regulator [Streptomyces sp. NPDC002536]
MVMQERAVRTREALVRAAAVEIDGKGYAGATLSGICKSAQVSMGALTFHFASKSELADAVVERGCEVTRELVEKVAANRECALGSVGALTLGLARLLEEDVAVRSAALLARERPEAGACWTAVWLPAVRGLLENAGEQGELRFGTPPVTVAALIAHLLAGAEVQRRCGDTVNRLEPIWELVLSGVAAAGA